MSSLEAEPRALLVVDAQRGFLSPTWGPRSNPACEQNIADLLSAWRAARLPVILVGHDSRDPRSPLAREGEGNQFLEGVAGEHDLMVRKSVHSAFHGDRDLDAWLKGRQLLNLVICGITTDHCCSTTARVAADLGYRVDFVLDATMTFERTAPGGAVLSADLVASAAAASLEGEFATVVDTVEALGWACSAGRGELV